MTFGEGTGHAYFFASHNGYASALVEFDARQTSKGRQILQRSTSYIDGSAQKVVHNVESEFRYRNYLQYKGVRPGPNQLTFLVRVSGSLTVERTEIFADSGIEYTRKGPARLKMKVTVPQGALRKNRASPISISVANVGDRLVRHVGIGIEFSPDVLRIAGAKTAKVGDMPPGSTRQRTFRVTPLRSGAIRIVLSASGSGGNQPAVSRTLIVR
jgi:hypothetical protein